MEGVDLGELAPEFRNKPRKIFDQQLGAKVTYEPSSNMWTLVEHKHSSRSKVHSRSNAFANRELPKNM